MTAKDTITRSVKISNNGKRGLAEDSAAAVIDVTGVSPDKSTTTVAVAATTTLNVTVAPASASDPSFRATTTDAGKTTVTVAGTVLTVTGISAGTADIIVMTNDGLLSRPVKSPFPDFRGCGPASGVIHVFKSEPFERNGKTVTLYELSALQRIEHLEHLKTLGKYRLDADMQAA